MKIMKGFLANDGKFYTYAQINWDSSKDSNYLNKLESTLKSRDLFTIEKNVKHSEQLVIKQPRVMTITEAKREGFEIVELFYSPMDEAKAKLKKEGKKNGLFKKSNKDSDSK